MATLTFEEFHAVRKRQRAKTKETTALKGAPGHNSSTKSVHLNGTARHSGSPETAFADGDSSKPAKSVRFGNSASSEKPPSGDASLVEDQGDGEGSNLPAKTGAEGLGELEPGLRPSPSTLGYFVEMYEVQLLVVLLVVGDLVCTVLELLMLEGRCRKAGGGLGGQAEGWPGLEAVLLRVMLSFTGFTAFFFVFELAVLVATFRGRFFRHAGYASDLVVVGVCLYCELGGASRELRLLGVLRLWRVARLVSTLVGASEDRHRATQGVLEGEQKRCLELQADVRRLEESLRREGEAKRRVEQMLRGYKDEVETLNEALKIAALDIAEAGRDDMEDVDDSADEMADAQEVPQTDGADGAAEQRWQPSDAERDSGQRKSARAAFKQIVVGQDGSFELR